MRFLLLILLALAGAAWAQTAVPTAATGNRIEGSGRVVNEVRAIAPFSAVRVSGPIDVTLKATGREQVTVQFDDNLAGLIQTTVAGEKTPTLDIRLQPGVSFRSGSEPKVIVEFRSISELTQLGSGEIVADVLTGPLLAISVSGSGAVRVGRVDVDVIGVAMSGSGDFSATGRATEQGYAISGSGEVHADELIGQTVKVRIAGSGDAHVYAESQLTVSIAGSGDVIYRGTPVIRKSIAGSGEVRRDR